MDALVEKLNAKLREWKPETAAQVRERVAEVIDLADHDVLDLVRSRAVEQEVLDLFSQRHTSGFHFQTNGAYVKRYSALAA